jgi:hypothetical protein
MDRISFLLGHEMREVQRLFLLLDRFLERCSEPSLVTEVFTEANHIDLTFGRFQRTFNLLVKESESLSG